MVPTTLDIRANGLNADNLLDGIISGSSFVPVFGWVLSPTFQAYKNNVGKRIVAGEGEEVIWSMEILIMMNCFAEGTQVLMGDRRKKDKESGHCVGLCNILCNYIYCYCTHNRKNKQR